MSITADAYGHSVSMTTDGTSDTYLVGGSRQYVFSAGTSDNVVSAKIAQQENMIIFNNALTDFLDAHYSDKTKLRWLILYQECVAFARPIRAAYIAQLLSWGDQISTYTSAYIVSLMGKTDLSDIVAMTFEPSQFGPDPVINLVTCMQIVG